MEIIQFKKEGDRAGYYYINEPPYTIGKLVKIKDVNAAIDFTARAKTLNYYIGHVPGYRIFFVHAGFFKKTSGLIKKVPEQIHAICDWYLKEKTPNNKTLKQFKI